MRPIDLARLAGVSTQQVRNYVDAGVLPPAPRTASGYRRFDERHRQALLTYRALAKGHGWETARQVMLAVHGGDRPAALALVDAGHAAVHEQRRSLDAAGNALEAMAGAGREVTGQPVTAKQAAGQQPVAGQQQGAGQQGTKRQVAGQQQGAGEQQGAGQQGTGRSVPVTARSGLRIGEVARHLGIRTSALRVWEAAGLLTPPRERGTRYRRYGPTDVRDARMINMLRQGRYPLTMIRPILDDLRQAGSTAALRAAIAERHAELNRRTIAMLEAAGHLHTYLLTQWSEEGPDVADEQVGGLE